MKISLRFLSAVSMIVLLILISGSCKKTDKVEDDNKEQRQLEEFKDKLRKEPFSYTQILNIPGKAFYADENGDQIFPGKLNSGRLLSVCPDPGDDYPSQNIYSVKTEFTCGSGYKVEVKYDLTLIYVPLYTNGSGTASFGRVRLKSGSTVIWPTVTPIPKYNVTDISNVGSAGNDPNGHPYTIWRITFKSDYIPEATFNSASSLESYLQVYTDCPDIPTVVIAYSPQQSTPTTNHNTLPCTRTDAAYWNPGYPGWPSSIAGCDPVGSGCFPPGYVFPDKQEIQFFYSGAWGFIKFKRPWGTPTDSVLDGRINYWDIYFIDRASAGISPGIYQARYRNVQTGSSNGGPCTGDWVYTNTWYLY